MRWSFHEKHRAYSSIGAAGQTTGIAFGKLPHFATNKAVGTVRTTLPERSPSPASTNPGDGIPKAVAVGVQYMVLFGEESGGQFHGD